MIPRGLVATALWLAFACSSTSAGNPGPSRGGQPAKADAPPQFKLKAGQHWFLDPPGGKEFEASGLLLLPDGALLTINDREAGAHRVAFRAGTNTADLVPLTKHFTTAQLAPVARRKRGQWDFEGIARDPEGRLLVCDESERWILRLDPGQSKIERLMIDWSPVEKFFRSADRNAGFEGLAVGGGTLYVANERQDGRILVVDLATLKVIGDFAVKPAGSKAKDIHYSDLCWFEDALWVLLRENRRVLRVDPATKRVLAEFHFAELERDPAVAYRDSSGVMEGLAVDRDHIWLVADNNGRPRRADARDKRPTLFKCHRPDRTATTSVTRP